MFLLSGRRYIQTKKGFRKDAFRYSVIYLNNVESIFRYSRFYLLVNYIIVPNLDQFKLQ